MYWYGLNDQLENLVLNCELFLKYSNSKYKQEPSLLPGQEVPLYPLTKFATDAFHFEGVSYLHIVDYTSRFPVVCKLTLMTGQHITSHFKLICSEYGWPETLVSDNGPCCTSEVFTNLMSGLGSMFCLCILLETCTILIKLNQSSMQMYCDFFFIL